MEGDRVEAVISDVVRSRFPGAAIHSVLVTRDVDGDEAPILRVTVVLSSSEKELDRAKMVGLVRHIRSKLDDIHVTEFPLVSYVSRSDAAKLKRETA